MVSTAEEQGLSLSRYVRRELEHLAKRTEAVRTNATVTRETQAAVKGRSTRQAILAALHDGRGE